MCTLVLFRDVVPGYPVVLAHNRDELLAREWEAPRLHPGEPRAVYPVDQRAKGTWFGVNEHGVVAAITNRMGVPVEEGRTSRGQLCVAAVAARSAGEALEAALRAVEHDAWNGFNLVVADPREAWLMTYDASTGSATDGLSQGVHIITSQHPLNPALLRDDRLDLLEAARDPIHLQEALGHWLADTRLRSETYAVCKHFGAYGTVCSSQMWLAEPLERSHLRFAPGPPDQQWFQETPLGFWQT